MLPKPLLKRLRQAIVLFVTVLFAAAPMTAAASERLVSADRHAECDLRDAGAQAGNPDTDRGHEGHDHAAHQCGVCHLHLMMAGDDDRAFAILSTAQPDLSLTHFKIYYSTDGPERPPRA